MFAGAVREAVLSNPNIIQRINSDFVPIALKAALMQNPPNDDEGLLYREIGRSKIAPQGICVVNSSGKALDWALMFDNDKSVLAFLDHSARRFAQFPDAKHPVAAERYMKYPSQKLEDVADSDKILPIPDRHPEGRHCSATPPLPRGTIAARLFGRALDKDGKFLTDTVPQENYVEDRFEVPVVLQERLAKDAASAGTMRFRLGDELARQLVSHAYLGQLDVLPISPPGHLGNLKTCEIWAKAEIGDSGLVQLNIEGKSEAGGAMSDGQNVGDERFLQHEVKLSWKGIIEMKGNRFSRLFLVAGGSEKLKSGKINLQLNNRADVSILPGGHAIDINCGVRYGIIGEPVSAEEAGPYRAPSQRTLAGAQAERPREVPDQARRGLMAALGPAFMVFRDKVQKDIDVSDVQKQKLAKRLQITVQDTMQFLQKLGDKTPQEREQELNPYRQKMQEKLVAFLKATLKEEQLKRLRQLELQQQGPSALFIRPDLGKELKITDEQRQQFMGLIREMQMKIEALGKDSHTGGSPEEIHPKIKQIHMEQDSRIEALLSVTQAKQWKVMRGKLIVLDY